MKHKVSSIGISKKKHQNHEQHYSFAQIIDND